MRRISSILLMVFFFVSLFSCSLFDEDIVMDNGNIDVFFASFESREVTRTTLCENGMLLWNPGDDISVFADGKYLGSFRASCPSPSESTGFYSFDFDSQTGDYIQKDIPKRADFIAVYPSVNAEQFDLSGSSFSILYPIVCNATTSFPPKNFFSIAKSEDQNLTFYHISGALRFTLTEDNVDTLIIRTKDVDDAIAGTARVKINENHIPEIASMSKCSQTLKVVPPEGLFFKTDTEYFITLPPGTYSNGLIFDMDTPYSTASRNIVKDVRINRSEISLLTNVNKGVTFAQKDGNDAYYETAYNYFNNIGGSVGIYCPYRFAFNLCGDDMYAAGEYSGDYDQFEEINEFRFDSSSTVFTSAYLNFLDAIYYATLFLHFQYGSSSRLDVQISEIRVLRAFCQMMLTIGWHNPPLYSSNSPDLSNSPYLDNLRWCAQECIDAAKYLPERISPYDKEGAYKVTKGFALAVAGKALLFAGDYNDARKHLKEVIDSGKYDLVSGADFWTNFHVEGDGNPEKLFESNIEYNPGVSLWDGPFPIIMRSTWMEANLWNWRTDHFQKVPAMVSFIVNSGGGWGGCGVAEEFANEFLENDGNSDRFKASIKHIDDVIFSSTYNDKEIDNMTLGNKKNSSLIGLRSPLYGQSFYLPYKPIVRSSDVVEQYGSNVRMNNFTYMRYAEVLLMYAECCLQTGNEAEALRTINMIQVRAGSKNVSVSVNMDILKAEKKYELWLEGCRWADLVRWGDTSGVKEAGSRVPSLNDKLFTTPPSSGTVVWENGSKDNSRFYVTYSHGAKDKGKDVGFKTGKHEYFPFPDAVMKDNPNIAQNPGW